MSYPVSAAFLAALTSGGRTPLVRASILSGGVPILVSTDNNPLYVTDGKVSVFDQAELRRTFEVTLPDPTGSLVPQTVGDLLDPASGNEIRLEAGLRLATGDEYVPVATGTIDNSNLTDTAGGIAIQITGADRAKRIGDNPWRTAWTVAAGTNTATAIQNIVNNRLTGVGTVVFNFTPTTQTVVSAVTLGGEGASSNPWKDCQDLAAGIGCEVFFDPAGVCVLRPVPDPDTAPVTFAYTENSNGILLDPMTRNIDRSTLRNGAIVYSEAPWLVFPLISSVWDDDPTSPLNRTARGEWPEKRGDPTVWSQAQADLAAAALFKQVRGVEEQVTWTSLPHYGLDVGDVITIATPRLFGGAPVRLSIKTLEVPMSVEGSMQGTTRRRRV